MMHNHNPFIYNTPVPVKHYINQQELLRVLFVRMRKANSTAIIGKPKMGKTSLLNYIATNAAWKDRLAREEQVILITKLGFDQEKNHVDSIQSLWQTIFGDIRKIVTDDIVKCKIEAVIKNKCNLTYLEEFFEFLEERNWQIILLIDQLDVLFNPPNSSTVDFLSVLHALAPRMNSLQVIITSTLSISEMDNLLIDHNLVDTKNSSLLSYLLDFKLTPFDKRSAFKLLDNALAQSASNIQFNENDRAFITWLGGQHPYLIQVAGAALFEANLDKQGEQKYALAIESFYRQTDTYFNRLWSSYIKDNAVIIGLCLIEFRELFKDLKVPPWQVEEPIPLLKPLRQLKELGLIEKVNINWPAVKARSFLWEGERWWMVRGFVWWFVGVLLDKRSRSLDIEQWLHEQPKQGHPFATEYRQTLLDLYNQFTRRDVVDMNDLCQQFVADFLLTGTNN